MSGTCGNCDCSDKSQCVKGNQYVMNTVEEQNTYGTGMTMEEGGSCGQCKCGTGCACTNCTCCTH